MAKPPTKNWFAERDEFLKQVGICITRWAAVDDQLFRIFNACVGGASAQCAILYYRITGLDARISTTNELVLSVLPSRGEDGSHKPVEVKAWEKTITGYQSLLGQRRIIAHQPLQLKLDEYYIEHPNELLFPPGYEQTSYVIYESEYERLRGRTKNERKPLEMDALRKHDHLVSSLGFRLQHFLDDTLSPHLRASQTKGPSPSP